MALQRFSNLTQMTLRTSEGELGTVCDLLAEDDRWNIRYLVITLNSPRRPRRVLISTAALSDVDSANSTITTELNSTQVLESPPVNFNKPISRRYEQALVDYYGWPIYWLGRLIRRSPREMYLDSQDVVATSVDEENRTNLRSINEICGYQLRSTDRAHGYLEDLVINIQSWTAVRAIVNPVANCPIMQPYSILPCRVFKGVDWAHQRIQVDTSSTLERRDSANVSGDSWQGQRRFVGQSTA